MTLLAAGLVAYAHRSLLIRLPLTLATEIGDASLARIVAAFAPQRPAPRGALN